MVRAPASHAGGQRFKSSTAHHGLSSVWYYSCYNDNVYFEILDRIRWIETIATERGIRELKRLNRIYGHAKWKKRKGIAKIRLTDGMIKFAELHWYEGHGQGRKEIKIKKYLE